MITYTIINNSVTTPAEVHRLVFTDQPQVQHHADFTGWNAPWSSYTDFTDDDTTTVVPVEYVSDVRPLNKLYLHHTGTAVALNNNTGIGIGWTLSNNGYTSGQTTVSTSGTNWVITSSPPNDIPIPGEVITFSPPLNLLYVTDNTGVSPGYIASSNGYTVGQTAVATSGSNWIVMSAPPNGSPTSSGPNRFINFVSTDDLMLTIAPASSSTFKLNYTNISSTYGLYTATVKIYVTLDSPSIKVIQNFISIAATPVDPITTIYQGGGGGFYFDTGFNPADNTAPAVEGFSITNDDGSTISVDGQGNVTSTPATDSGIGSVGDSTGPADGGTNGVAGDAGNGDGGTAGGDGSGTGGASGTA